MPEPGCAGAGAVAAAGSAAGRSLQGVRSPPPVARWRAGVLASGSEVQLARASLLPVAICLLGQGALDFFERRHRSP